MKKFIALTIAVLMMFSSLGVFAKTDFLTEVYNNYTADYSFKISFDSGDEVLSLLNEMSIPKEVENFVDLKKLLTSVLSLDAKMLLQLDASEDMKKIKMALTADANQNIDINKNLNIDVKSKTGMWITIDISDKNNPVMQVIYSYPFLNKYMVIDAFEMASEEEKAQIVSTLGAVMNREFVAAANTYCMEVLKKYADIRVSSGKCIISMDNEALTKMLDEIIPYITRQMAGTMLNVAIDTQEFLEVLDMFESISFDGLKLLGDKGIKYTYILKNGKISQMNVDADICIDVSNIYTALTGEVWNFVSSGKIEFSVASEAKLSKINTTSVAMPVLTQENSFSVKDMMPEYEMLPEEEYEEEFPYWYVGDWTEALPVIDNEVFVPLRSVLEGAYADKVSISYDNGAITAVSDYFPGFTKMMLTVGGNKVYTETVEYTTKNVIMENGITYVSSKLFEELFGWELIEAQHSYMTGVNYYEFYTHD